MRHWAFDLDGTILDCRRRQVALMRELVNAALRLEFDGDAYWMKKREGLTNDQALIGAGVPESAIESLCKSWLKAVEDEEWLALDEPLEGAAEALRSARDYGIELIIVTARCQPAGVHRTLARLELEALIDHVCVVSPNSGVSSQKARYLCHYRTDKFFGDSESDYYSARLADVEFAGVECGQRSARYLRDLGAMTFPTLQDAVADALQRSL